MIYFLKGQDTGLIKVGYSVNATGRLRSLRTASAETLTLLRLLDGTRAAERTLHLAFSEYRKRGEWFDLPDAIVTGPMDFPDLPLPEPKPPMVRPPRNPSAEQAANAQYQAAWRRRREEKLAILTEAINRITDEAKTLKAAREIAAEAREATR